MNVPKIRKIVKFILKDVHKNNSAGNLRACHWMCPEESNKPRLQISQSTIALYAVWAPTKSSQYVDWLAKYHTHVTMNCQLCSTAMRQQDCCLIRGQSVLFWTVHHAFNSVNIVAANCIWIVVSWITPKPNDATWETVDATTDGKSVAFQFVIAINVPTFSRTVRMIRSSSQLSVHTSINRNWVC